MHGVWPESLRIRATSTSCMARSPLRIRDAISGSGGTPPFLAVRSFADWYSSRRAAIFSIFSSRESGAGYAASTRDKSLSNLSIGSELLDNSDS